MIEMEYVFKDLLKRDFLVEDRYNRKAHYYASAKKVALATYAFLFDNDTVNEVWVPYSDKFDHWRWINEKNYKDEVSQIALQRLLNLFDIPLPDEQIESINMLEEIIF